jgi:isoleucyl-tRNA synthetase
MDASYMESVWWVFSRLYAQNLVYPAHNVLPYSTALCTSLSNFEAGLNYKDTKDPAIVVSFPLVERPKVSLVAWTSAPWILASNVALCVNSELTYAEILDVATDRTFVLAKKRICQLYPVMNTKRYHPSTADDLYQIIREIPGSELVGLRYVPLFDYFAADGAAATEEAVHYFQLLADPFVGDDVGTGIIHLAPAFGEDEYRVCLAAGLIREGGNLPCPVNKHGEFTSHVHDVQGLHVKAADEPLMDIINRKGRLVQKDVLVHSHPFCWRSDTPLINKAVRSWFVRVEDIRDQIVANNQDTNWVPPEIKDGKFRKWLGDARDWIVETGSGGPPSPSGQTKICQRSCV